MSDTPSLPPGSTFTPPAGTLPAGLTPPVTSAWPRVPGYEILGELGRGGMGVVYRARQVGLDRTVALKLLHGGGQAGEEERARFRTEALAVSRLQHPNVVQIHDVGESDGQPYFSMEFCPGGSLDRRLDGTPWPAPRAAALVETLARAVQAAHDAGVIHRDLKPANVLVGPASRTDAPAEEVRPESLTCKIADFGLARRTGGAGQTQTGDVLGTPSYMAPEQARGRPKDVGPAADVYALGAILYELLTGRPPFRGETPLDTLAQVVDLEPVPVRRLHPRASRDAETICLKCLHKEPTRRYASAAALADDLHRLQEGRPILARPAGVAERLWRWCRRQPAVAGLAATLVLVVAGAIGGLTALLLRADRLRRAAEHERAEAATDYRLARESVDRYATRVSEDLRLRNDDLRPLRKELLEQVAPFYEKLARRHADRPELQAERGKAYKRLAEITAEIADKGKAITLLEKAVAVLGQVVRDDPADLPPWRDLTACRSHLADLYHQAGRAAEAQAELRSLLAVQERLAADHPGEPAWRRDLARSHNSLAVSYLEAGEPSRGLDHARQAVAALGKVTAEHPGDSDAWRHLAACRATLAALYHSAGKVAEAGDECRKAVAELEEVVRRHPTDAASRHELATARRDLGGWYAQTGNRAGAEAQYRKAIDELEAVVRRHPSVTDYQRTLATCLQQLAGHHSSLGQDADARAVYERALGFYRKLSDQHPGIPAHRHHLADALAGLAALHYHARRTPQAEEAYKEALRLRQGLVDRHPDFPEYRHDLALVHNNLAALYQTSGRRPAAAPELAKALHLLGPLAEQFPHHQGYQTTLAQTRLNLAAIHFQSGRAAQALEEYGKARPVLEGLARRHPSVTAYAHSLGTLYCSLGTVSHDLGKPAEALPWFARAVTAFEGLLKTESRDAHARRGLRITLCERARSLNRLSRPAEALKDCDRALTIEPGEATRALRARTQARLGRHAPALAEADQLARVEKLPGIAWYDLACLHALGAAAVARDTNLPADERGRQGERHAARAVELLGKARAAGFFSRASRVERLRPGGDFEALRGRPDFRQLLADLTKAMPTGPR